MKNIKFPQYISTNKRTVSVVGVLEDKEELHTSDYIEGKGYIDKDGFIWIYCDHKPRNANEYPYFWIVANKACQSDPSPVVKAAYSQDNMQDLSIVSIVDNTAPGEKLYNEKEIEDMNSSSAFYVPIVNDTDDFLKKVVKNTIIEKGIDINRLKGKTDEKYILPNMKAALQNKTKMSVLYFCYWMNLLGCNFEITVSDDGSDNNDPLKYPIVYQSYRDNVSKIVNGDIIDITPSKESVVDEDSE